MTPLYNDQEFKDSKSHDKLPCKCEVCSQIFSVRKTDLKKAIKGQIDRKYNCCSIKCNHIHEGRCIKTSCTNCEKEVFKMKKDIKSSKSGNVFCSKSCSASYNNKNKKHGTRRSKLEAWIESELEKIFPSLKVYFNQSDAIGSELDIYVPTLNLAFELNGIFHYEPIYGVDKLQQIQENDQSKIKACHEAEIDLCIIDVSGQDRFKVSSSKKYLNIIEEKIKRHLMAGSHASRHRDLTRLKN